MSPPDDKVNHSNGKDTKEDDAGPVHRAGQDWRSEWPEGEEPERKHERECGNVNGQSGSAQRPSPRWQRRSV